MPRGAAAIMFSSAWCGTIESRVPSSSAEQGSVVAERVDTSEHTAGAGPDPLGRRCDEGGKLVGTGGQERERPEPPIGSRHERARLCACAPAEVADPPRVDRPERGEDVGGPPDGDDVADGGRRRLGEQLLGGRGCGRRVQGRRLGDRQGDRTPLRQRDCVAQELAAVPGRPVDDHDAGPAPAAAALDEVPGHAPAEAAEDDIVDGHAAVTGNDGPIGEAERTGRVVGEGEPRRGLGRRVRRYPRAARDDEREEPTPARRGERCELPSTSHRSAAVSRVPGRGGSESR